MYNAAGHGGEIQVHKVFVIFARKFEFESDATAQDLHNSML
jgi:hypothetical protein